MVRLRLSPQRGLDYSRATDLGIYYYLYSYLFQIILLHFFMNGHYLLFHVSLSIFPYSHHLFCITGFHFFSFFSIPYFIVMDLSPSNYSVIILGFASFPLPLYWVTCSFFWCQIVSNPSYLSALQDIISRGILRG